MSEFLSFAKKINNDTYVLYFSENIDAVWGEFWNVCPASIIGGTDLDEPFVSSYLYFTSKYNLLTAEKNNCFSMQDCIDGIIPLIFTSLEENPLIKDGKSFYLKFGINKDEAKNILDFFSINILKEESNIDKTDEIMDDLMNDLDGIKNSDNFDF